MLRPERRVVLKIGTSIIGYPSARQMALNSRSIKSSFRVSSINLRQTAMEYLGGAVDIPVRQIEQRAAFQVVDQRSQASLRQFSRILRLALITESVWIEPYNRSNEDRRGLVRAELE